MSQLDRERLGIPPHHGLDPNEAMVKKKIIIKFIKNREIKLTFFSPFIY